MTDITPPSSPLPGNVTRSDLLATFEDWLGNLGIRIGDIPEIKVDLTENETAYIVHADIPGANKDDIKVQLEGNRVSISVERKRWNRKRVNELFIANVLKNHAAVSLGWIRK